MNNLIKYYKEFPIPVRAVFWLTICTFLQKGLSVITIPMFTRILTAEEYGQFSIFVSWENICQLFTTISLHTGVFNCAMVQNEDSHNRVISVYLGLTSMLTILFFGLYLMMQKRINNFMGMNSPLVMLLFVNLFFAPAYNLWLAKQRYEYNYQSIVIYTLMTSVIGPIVSFIWVVLSKDRAMARILSMTVVSCLFYLLLYIHIFMRGKCIFDKELWKKAFLVNVPLIPHFLSGTILNQADRLMINTMIGKSEAGIYSVAYSAAMLLQIIISSVNTSIIPWLYNELKKNTGENIKGTLNIMVLLMGGAVVIFMLFAPECMRLLASEEYFEAIWIFPPLTASIYFIFIYNLFCDVELYYQKSLYITVASCVTAGLNILLNYISIPFFGYVAAGYTTLISYIIYAAIHYCCMRMIVKKENIKSPIDIKFVMFFSICILISSIAIRCIYQYVLIRYGIIILVSLFVFLNKRKVEEILKELKRG